MAPRTNEGECSTYQGKSCSDGRDMEINNFIPCLMHKKHKVVKLIKGQLQKIHEDGLLNQTTEMAERLFVEEFEPRRSEGLKAGPSRRTSSSRYTDERGSSMDPSSLERSTSEFSASRGVCIISYFIAFFLALVILVFLMVWISAGPLSNFLFYTPIPPASFVRTDSTCSLERKYLLRWSKPEYFE